MNFVCSMRFDDGSVVHNNFTSANESDACWDARQIATDRGATLVNVWYARGARQNRRTRTRTTV